MSYQSVDELQKVLTTSVFHYAKDKKKAAGRALGTLVEVITFYLLKAWNFSRFLAIERHLPEYSNNEITHNVEYSLHPSFDLSEIRLAKKDLPFSAAKIARALTEKGIRVNSINEKTHQLLSSKLVLRNACTIANDEGAFLVASIKESSGDDFTISVNRLFNRPFALAECKRVGIEEGMRKGPQTIEKAKQGAYVARTVSSLQKIRLASGEIGGIFATHDGKIICKRYDEFLREIIDSTNPEFLRSFILTIGVVSNHGNWFTTDNHNKELRVLAQSYDWLLFLTDQGLAEFIQDLILDPSQEFRPIREAFLASYTGKSGANQFTKVKMSFVADTLLQIYFHRKLKKIESWFNVIAPKKQKLSVLGDELRRLSAKNWREIHQ
jgi:hypothetical protein